MPIDVMSTGSGKARRAVFPYVPNSVPEVKAQMVREIGAKDEMDLYAEIPERLRFKRWLRLP